MYEEIAEVVSQIVRTSQPRRARSASLLTDSIAMEAFAGSAHSLHPHLVCMHAYHCRGDNAYLTSVFHVAFLAVYVTTCT